MSRTTQSNVKSILGDHYDGKSAVQPFIDSAASLVNKISSNDTDGLLSSSDLELIERWLSAHFYAHMDQFFQSKNTGRAGGSFQGQTAMVFTSTLYGQTALALDVTGYLSKIQQQAQNGPRKARVTWGGTRYRNDHSERHEDQ